MELDDTFGMYSLLICVTRLIQKLNFYKEKPILFKIEFTTNLESKKQFFTNNDKSYAPKHGAYNPIKEKKKYSQL